MTDLLFSVEIMVFHQKLASLVILASPDENDIVIYNF